MSMKKTAPAINLFKKNKNTFLDNFIHWALSFGRILIVATEAIALAVFLYRFTLDRQIIDLHDEIQQKKTYVDFQKNNEIKFRNLQERLAFIQSVADQGPASVIIFQDITSLAPTDFFIKSFTQSPESIRITAEVQSVTSLSTFVSLLREYPSIATVSVDRIENRPSQAVIAVSISAFLKQKGEK